MRRCGLLRTEQMLNRLARGKAPCCFAKLLSLDDAVNPPIEDLDNDCSGLEALGPH
jgi:hypothetical protein